MEFKDFVKHMPIYESVSRYFYGNKVKAEIAKIILKNPYGIVPNLDSGGFSVYDKHGVVHYEIQERSLMRNGKIVTNHVNSKILNNILQMIAANKDFLRATSYGNVSKKAM